MNKDNNDFIMFDLTGFIVAIMKRFWVFLLCVAIGAGAGAAYSTTIRTAPLYKSTAKLYITGSYTATLSASTITAGTAIMSSYFSVMESRPVIDQLKENLGLTLTNSQIKSCISHKAITGTSMATIELSFPDREWAQEILTELLALTTQRTYEVMGMAPPTVVEEPSLPVNPYNITSNLRHYTLLGAIVGFGLAAVIVLIMILTDNKLHNAKQVTFRTGLEVKGITPKTKKGLTSEYTAKAMSYLYSEICASKDKPKVVSFVSNFSEDKKALVEDFSAFLAGLGKEVAVLDTNMLVRRVDADVVVSQEEGEENPSAERKYLEDYLTGETSNLDDVILFKGNVGYVRNSKECLNSYELLKSDNCKNLFNALREKFDFVVVDTVPFMNANDAEAILDKADANVCVLTCNKSTNKHATAITERFGKDKLLGAVLTNIKIKKSKSFIKKYGKFVGMSVEKSK